MGFIGPAVCLRGMKISSWTVAQSVVHSADTLGSLPHPSLGRTSCGLFSSKPQLGTSTVNQDLSENKLSKVILSEACNKLTLLKTNPLRNLSLGGLLNIYDWFRWLPMEEFLRPDVAASLGKSHLITGIAFPPVSPGFSFWSHKVRSPGSVGKGLHMHPPSYLLRQ